MDKHKKIVIEFNKTLTNGLQDAYKAFSLLIDVPVHMHGPTESVTIKFASSEIYSTKPFSIVLTCEEDTDFGNAIGGALLIYDESLAELSSSTSILESFALPCTLSNLEPNIPLGVSELFRHNISSSYALDVLKSYSFTSNAIELFKSSINCSSKHELIELFNESFTSNANEKFIGIISGVDAYEVTKLSSQYP